MFQDFNITKKIPCNLIFACICKSGGGRERGTSTWYKMQFSTDACQNWFFTESLHFVEKIQTLVRKATFCLVNKSCPVTQLCKKKCCEDFMIGWPLENEVHFWNLLFCWFTHDTVKKNLSGQCTQRTLNYFRRSKWWAVNCRNK